MRLIRSVLFWLHLASGLAAGLVIGLMCVTGAMLAFEKEWIAWAERDARQVTVPPDASRLPLAELSRQIQLAYPDVATPSFTVHADPAMAVACTLSRNQIVYLNPYDGSIRTPDSLRTAQLMRTLREWHRYLSLSGDRQPYGKGLTGASNLAFAFLAMSGLYLWWPRTWSWRGLKAIALFNVRLTGRSRDFNWHNAIGLWCAPVLIVLTLTAVPISYRWGGTLIERLTASSLNAPPAAAAPAHNKDHAAPPGTLDNNELDRGLALAQAQFPSWQSITVRHAAGQVLATVRDSTSWPRTASTTLTMEPSAGRIVKREGHADQTAARRVRSWTRFLHTGEALGWPGQLIAGFACLGGCLLVYTGFALSWRRFFTKKPTS